MADLQLALRNMSAAQIVETKEWPADSLRYETCLNRLAWWRPLYTVPAPLSMRSRTILEPTCLELYRQYSGNRR